LKGAIGWFEKAISMDARRAAELAVEIGKCYELLNDTNQAIQYYSNALPDTMSSSDAAIAISKIYIQRDQFKIATTALQRSLKIFPACAECWTNLADLYLKLGERKECIECDKIAAKLGDVSAQNRLRNSFIPYDSVDFSVLPWMDANPFAQSWWREWIRQDHLSAPDFVPLEKLPVPVKIVQPDYPELARRTGVEGEVQVKCLLDKHGRVVKVVLLKADPEIFAVPAINAAYQWEFSPPILKGTPVVCWVSVPFRFKLNK
jgi:protein TonB